MIKNAAWLLFLIIEFSSNKILVQFDLIHKTYKSPVPKFTDLQHYC